jgi:hypothetical protein
MLWIKEWIHVVELLMIEALLSKKEIAEMLYSNAHPY